MDEKFNFDLSEANAFFVELNYKKIQYEKQVATKCIGFFYYLFNPAFCKYNVLVAQPNVIEIKYIKKHFFMYLSV